MNRLRAVVPADELLASHGYRVVWVGGGGRWEGWHVLWSADHEQSDSVCLGMAPPHLIERLPALLEQHGWPTRPLGQQPCGFHHPAQPEGIAQ